MPISALRRPQTIGCLPDYRCGFPAGRRGRSRSRAARRTSARCPRRAPSRSGTATRSALIPKTTCAVVADDRDADGVPGEQRHERQHLDERRAERVEALLRAGHVGDRQVEHPRAAEHRPREQAAGERRPEVGDVDDRLAAGALRAGLQLLGALQHAPVAAPRVGLARRAARRTARSARCRAHARVGAADVDRHLRAQPARRAAPRRATSSRCAQPAGARAPARRR